MPEFKLRYEDLTTAGSDLAGLSADVRGNGGFPVVGCETGIVDVSFAFSAIFDDCVALSDYLDTMSQTMTEIVNEVVTVDKNQANHYPPTLDFGDLLSGHVHQITFNDPNPVLVLPPGLQPPTAK